MGKELILKYCRLTFIEASTRNGRPTTFFELSSLNSIYPIRLYKKTFDTFYTHLGNCFTFVEEFMEDDIETKDYVSYDIYTTNKNVLKLTVSGFVSDKGNQFLNVFLKVWHKPEGDNEYHCTKSGVRFDPASDQLTKIAAFYKTCYNLVPKKTSKTTAVATTTTATTTTTPKMFKRQKLSDEV